jgi:hemin uptake protein HemP
MSNPYNIQLNNISVGNLATGDTADSVARRSNQAAPLATRALPEGKTRRISSAELFAGSKELLIDHANDSYVLRHTNQGKLILTK